MSFELTQRRWLLALSAEVTPESLGNPKAFSIYRNNYQQNLLAVLARCFPVCQSLMGEECFVQVGLRYIASNPSRSTWLQTYGAGFALFLSGLPGMKEYTPYMPDVAHAEYLLYQAYYESSQEASSPDNAFYTLYSPFPIHQIIAGEECSLEAGQDYYFVIERAEFKPEIKSINKARFEHMAARFSQWSEVTDV